MDLRAVCLVRAIVVDDVARVLLMGGVGLVTKWV